MFCLLFVCSEHLGAVSMKVDASYTVLVATPSNCSGSSLEPFLPNAARKRQD